MKKLFVLAAAAALVAGSAAMAHADTLAYNANVADNGSGNLFFGSGNPNGDFATSTSTDTNASVQLGLRADIRFGSLIVGTDSGSGDNNLYTVPAGGSPDAAWDFVYSIQDKNGFGNYIANLKITNPDGSTLTSGDPTNALLGNGIGLSGTVQQNAENIGFNFIGGNPNTLGIYTFDLTYTDKGTGASAEDVIKVDAVATPLPSAASMGFGMLAVIGAAGMLRKKLRTA